MRYTSICCVEEMIQSDFSINYTNIKALMPKPNDEKKSNICNQCDYASSRAGDLKRHLKSHTGEKPNICNQCDYASSYASPLRIHLKTHSGEEPNKCNQCDYASSQAGDLKRHLKTQIGESQTNATSVILHPFGQAL